ncbi:MAG: RnfABCDGE type electron transport complex subunit D [Treponema sp.]|nr:RnfABCDGE type electron transport complex subunit D [Treponema sp.]
MPEQEALLKLKPQINISRPTAGRMWLVFFCASLAVIQSALSDSGASLVVALTSLCCAVLTELAITRAGYGFEKIRDGSAAASAMVLALLLPNQIHPVYAGVGAVFAMAVVKHSFGGLGSNWVNPALGGWLFIRFSWSQAFSRALEHSPLTLVADTFENGVSTARMPPLELLKSAGAADFSGAGSAVDLAISNFLNNTVFSLFGAELPSGYIGLLVLKSPGIIADRGVLALALGTIVITAFQISRAWVPALYLGVFGLLVWLAGDMPFGGLPRNGDMLFALFTGGTLAAAFILIPEPASGAKSKPGMCAAAVLGAAVSFVFRYRSLEFYGCFFAAALINALTPLIRSIEGRWLYSRKRQRRCPAPGGGAV